MTQNNSPQSKQKPQILEIHIPEEQIVNETVHTPDNKEVFNVINQIVKNPMLFKNRQEIGLLEPTFNPENNHILEQLTMSPMEDLSQHNIVNDGVQSETFANLNREIDNQRDLVSNLLSHKSKEKEIKEENIENILNEMSDLKNTNRDQFKQFVFNLGKIFGK